MTKAEFKARWDGDEKGGGITFEDIANCAVEWGLFNRPRCVRIDIVANRVTRAAGCRDVFPLREEDLSD